MARTLNRDAHAVRRDAFVDAALRLIQTKGYEQMSVQDLLDDLGASRGAFYHYFDSKAALLVAVIERMLDLGLAVMRPIAADPALRAPDKLAAVFSGIAAWKNARRDLMVRLLEVWLSDDNAIVREKYRRAMAARLTPMLAEIIRQGITEGTLSTRSPEDAARVLVSLLVGAQETAGELYMARQAGTVPLESVERIFGAYAEGYERILGARPGSLPLVDGETLRLWFG